MVKPRANKDRVEVFDKKPGRGDIRFSLMVNFLSDVITVMSQKKLNIDL